MPFKSQAQRGYLFAKKPEVAKKFAADSHLDVPKRPGGMHPPGKRGKRRKSADVFSSMLSGDASS